MNYSLVQISDIGKVITGNTPSKKKNEYYNSNDIMFIKPNDFEINKISSLCSSTEYLSVEGAESGRKVKTGAVLVTCIGIIGKVGIAQSDLCFNQQINAIVVDTEKIESKYLAYSIIYRRKQLEAIANAPVVPIINKSQFSKFQIPLPSLFVQKKIVQVLDKAQELIDLREKQIQLLDDLVQSVFYDTFGDPVTNPTGWKIKPLSHFGEWKSGGTPSRSNTEFYKGNIPWVSSGELNEIYIIDTIEHITSKAISESATKEIVQGSLLLGMYDTAALKSSITQNTMTCNQAIAFSRLDDNLCNTKFIYWYIQIGKEHFRRMQRGVRQKNMNLSMIKQLPIFSAPLALQNNFADKVQKIESQKSLMQKSLKEMKNSYNSLMQRAFKGELFSE